MQAAILSFLPSPVLGFLIVGGITALSLAGMLLVRRSVELETLEAHREIAGFIIAVVGVIYAVILALVVIAVWEDYEDARATAEREANMVAGLYRLSYALPAADQAPMRQAVEAYARTVVDEEWPLMRRGAGSDRAWGELDNLWRILTASKPQTPAETAAYQEELDRMDGLGDARRDRLLASREALPAILWTVLIGGAITTIGFTYFFGVRRLAAQALMTTALGVTIGLALFLIFAMDLPFSGDVSVPPEGMEQVLAMFARG